MPITRRDFLVRTGAGIATVGLSQTAWGLTTSLAEGQSVVLVPTALVPTSCRAGNRWLLFPSNPDEIPPLHTFQIWRPHDLLILEIRFDPRGVRIEDFFGKRAYRNRNHRALFTVRFPPQHVAEDWQDLPFPAQNPLPPLKPSELPLACRFSEPSRIVLELPIRFEHQPFDLTLSRLLEWTDLPSVTPDVGADPPEDVTAIELPFGMKMSPSSAHVWSRPLKNDNIHRDQDASNKTTFELWHARLVGPKANENPKMKAVWSRPTSTVFPRAFPDDASRQAIVANCTKYPSIEAREFSLSALGGNADLHGIWPNPVVECSSDINSPPPDAVEEWIQRTSWGRDHFVQVTYKGFLFPFAHRASLVVVNRRMFRRLDGADTETALLNRYAYIVLKQEQVDYLDPGPTSFQVGRNLPWNWVKIKTPRTSLLDASAYQHKDTFFWIIPLHLPANQDYPFIFEAEAQDRQGTLHPSVKLKAMWVAAGWLKCKPQDKAQLTIEFNRPPEDWRATELYHRRLAFVMPRPAATAPDMEKQNKDDVAVETDSITWDAEFDRPGWKYQTDWMNDDINLRFYPTVKSALVYLDGAAAFAGGNGAPKSKLNYEEKFVENGFAESDLEIWADIDVPGGSIPFDAARSGGLATPAPHIRAISRMVGPYNAAPTRTPLLAAGTTKIKFDPLAFFDAAAQLLGGVSLQQVIAPVQEAIDDIARVPKLVAEQVNSALQQINEVRSQIQPVLDLIVAITKGDNPLQVIRQRLMALVIDYVRGQLVDQWKKDLEAQLESEFLNARMYVDNLAGRIIANVEPAVEPAVRAAIQAQEVYKLLQDAGVIEVIRDYIKDPNNSKLQKLIFTRLEQALKSEAAGAEAAAKDAARQWLEGQLQGAAPLVQDLQSLNQNLARLRERIISEYRVKRNATEEQIVKLRDAFDRRLNAAIQNVTGYYAAAMSAVDQFTEFPFQRIFEIKQDIETILDTVRNPDQRLFELPRRFQELANHLSELLGGKVGALADDSLVQEADRFAKRISQQARNELNLATASLVQDWKTASDAIAAVDANLPTAIPDLSGDIPWKTALDNIRDSILSAANQYRDQVLGHLANELEGQLPPWINELKLEFKTARTFLTKLSSKLVDIANLIEGLLASIPTEVKLQYDWYPGLRDAPEEKPFFEAKCDGTPASFELHVSVRKSLVRPTEPPQVNINGSLQNFTINLIPSAKFLSVLFDELSFQSVNGNKPDVTPKIRDVKFSEALEFISKLAEALSPDTGPFLEVRGLGILVGFRFELPAITSGAFNLCQLGINVGVDLPFTGDPTRVEFSISTPEKPFLITVGILGGGGYFGLRLRPTGVDQISGLFQFGAAAFVDLGVAQGQAEIMAFISFTTSHERESVRGGVRILGSLRVIDMINMSLTVEVVLGYEKSDGQAKLVGEATLTLEIEFCFFSITVSLTCRKEFIGGGGETKQVLLGVVSPFNLPPETQVQVDGYRAACTNWPRRRRQLYQGN